MVQEKQKTSATNGHRERDWAHDIPTKLQSVLLDVTPEMARSWLEMSGEGHRTISGPKAQRIARDIITGDYLVTANGIGFDSQGRLIDGRHRLTAICEAELPIRTFVIFGLDPIAIDVTDATRPRNQGDVLHMAGEKSYRALAAVITHLWRYERKLWGKSNNMAPSIPEGKKWLAEHPEVRESVTVSCNVGRILQQSVAAASHHIFSQIDRRQADEFFEKLLTGVGMNTDDPIRRLREKMLADKLAKRSMGTTERFALTINAWNAFREGRPLTYLIWKSQGKYKQPFPTAR